MHSSLVYLLAFTASIAAQTNLFYQVPACARSCAAALPSSCAGNAKCICENTAWMNEVECCVSKACDSADQVATFKFATQLCNYVGVTLVQPSTCSALTQLAATTTVATTLATSTHTAAAAAVNTVEGYVAQGCYSEATNYNGGQRALNETHHTDAKGMTVAECVRFCSSHGLRVAGLEHAEECWCGDAIVNGGAKLAGESGCNFPCKGNSAETCGGLRTLDVYQKPT